MCLEGLQPDVGGRKGGRTGRAGGVWEGADKCVLGDWSKAPWCRPGLLLLREPQNEELIAHFCNPSCYERIFSNNQNLLPALF